MKNLVVLTGAGMSAESGISTFRDAGGLWDKYPVVQVVYGISIRWSKWLLRKAISATLHW